MQGAEWPELTSAERAVLEYALKAETARADEIAAALDFAPSYVRKLLMRLRRAFEADDNAQMVLRADRRRGMRE